MFGSRKNVRVEGSAAPNKSQSQLADTSARTDAKAGSLADTGTSSGAELDPEEAKRRGAAMMRVSVAFAQVVSVLMRSPAHKHFSLADLEWIVLPPLLAGQFSLAEVKAQPNAPSVPVAAVLWASVSPEVDKRLTDNIGAAIRLRPDEWKSGNILWLIDAVGDGRVLPQFLKELNEKAFKGRDVKMRARGEGGKPIVRQLAAMLAAKQPG